ncbi:MAG: hypothetical protein KZQ91_09500 [Candidatus Thiodiazotropha sp. (ex Lucinoma borealis)]|nr:hypothetical protein [Candidatus Thiodiazotropha sp. (ex Lucinoma borealis)]
MARAADDLRFNRVTKWGRRTYLTEYANGRVVGEEAYSGFIKCKLVHNRGYSLVLPDQVYIEFGGEVLWFQPLYYSSCIISNYEEHGECLLSIDISHCVVLNVTFTTNDVVNRLADCSLVYKCEVKAPKYLYRYSTGSAVMGEAGPRIKLYHHTNRKAREGIVNGAEYWSSDWNIQGTKKLANISYLYLTSLPAIETDEDLGVIAMSSDGRLVFQTDFNTSGTPELELTVYRESTAKRTEVLSHWVEATRLATQPAYRHRDPGGFGYHEVVCQFVHRIGVESGTTVAISRNSLEPHSPKDLGYAVVGDATTVEGLAAPYDEEHTHDVFKIERLDADEDIIGFWGDNANSDQFSTKTVEEAELVEPEM